MTTCCVYLQPNAGVAGKLAGERQLQLPGQGPKPDLSQLQRTVHRDSKVAAAAVLASCSPWHTCVVCVQLV